MRCRYQQSIAFLHIDFSSYEATTAVLYNLYDTLDVGGRILLSGFSWAEDRISGTREAVLDFRGIHQLDHDSPIFPLDSSTAFFVKSRSVHVDRVRFVKGDTRAANRSSFAQVWRRLWAPHWTHEQDLARRL